MQIHLSIMAQTYLHIPYHQLLDCPLESGVIHLINTNQEACLMSIEIMLNHQQLYGLHQISLLLH